MRAEIEPRRKLVNYLPAIYQRSSTVADFLAAFERTLLGENHHPALLGEGDEEPKGLAELIDEIPALLDPEETREEFLPWLAQWAAISDFDIIPESRRRNVIHKMIPLYAIRGTKAYVEQVIWLYTGVRARVEEGELPPMRLGVTATVGEDTRLGQDTFHFRVHLDLASVSDAEARLPEMLALQKAIVTLAKPAHTHFKLEHNVPGAPRGLVISVRSTVGVDTLLWHD